MCAMVIINKKIIIQWNSNIHLIQILGLDAETPNYAIHICDHSLIRR